MKIFKSILFVLLMTAFFQPGNAQSILIDPEIQYQQVDGWGGSLCWWANIMGGYSDIEVQKICDWITDPQGLNMNIFRFNIGGGDNPEHQHMRGDGGDMPGYKVSATAPYDWSRDANQRRITQQLIRSRVRLAGVNDIFLEAFSNSPPWWMTRSGCSAGSTEGNVTNLKSDMFDDFADYLTEVTQYYHDSLGITFQTLEPFNEPFSIWWKALGGQEGCYFGQADQERMIRELHKSLQDKNMLSYCSITAMDSNTLDECFIGITAYLSAGDILPRLSKINAHSYFGSENSRKNLAGFCRTHSMKLWQSESGPLNMSGSQETLILAMASRIIRDMKEMRCDAWIDWQLAADNSPVWGLITGKYNEPTHPVTRGDAYYIRAQFSRFIQKGYAIVDCKDPNTLVAINPGQTELVIVICNEAATETDFNYDLGAFKTVGSDLVRFRSGKVNDSYTEKLSRTTVSLDGRILNYQAPKKTVTTFVIPVTMAERKVTGGRYTFRNKACNQLIGIRESSDKVGEYLVITGELPGSNSQFDLVADPSTGGFQIKPAHIAPSRNFVLDVEGISGADRARVMQYPDWGGENQRFHFVYLEDDFYRIVIRKSMKCLSLPDHNYLPGAPVLQMSWDQGDHSVWEVKKPDSKVPAIELNRSLCVNYEASRLTVVSTDNSILKNLHLFTSTGTIIRSLFDINGPGCTIPLEINPGIYFLNVTWTDGYNTSSKFIRN